MSRSIRALVDTIIEAMRERPDTFLFAEHTMTDTKTGIIFWTSGASYSHGTWKPTEIDFGWWHGRRFKRAVRELKAAQTIGATIAATIEFMKELT